MTGDARAVDERIDPSELRARALEQASDLIVLAHVGGNRERTPARSLDVPDHLRGAVRALAIVDDDVVTAHRSEPTNGSADAARATSDNQDAPRAHER